MSRIYKVKSFTPHLDLYVFKNIETGDEAGIFGFDLAVSKSKHCALSYADGIYEAYDSYIENTP